jgi:predicted nucleotidyltransferase
MRIDSDVDLLIEFEPGHSPSLAGFVCLKQELEATLGVQVSSRRFEISKSLHESTIAARGHQ